MASKHTLFALALFVLLAPPAAQAQKAVAVNAAIRPADGFRAEFFANLDDVQQKILALAEATPAEKYAWRPAADVRSISEVYMHIAGSNDVLLTFAGVPAPKTNGDVEKTVTTKKEVIAELRKSFERLRAAVSAMQNMEKPARMFGKPTTARAVLVMILSHLHEHLGQSIAYARMNGVIPPWSR